MRFFRKLIRRGSRNQIQDARNMRAQEIEALGMKLRDESGWGNGTYVAKRYLIEKDGEIVAGPFASSSEALKAARNLSRG